MRTARPAILAALALLGLAWADLALAQDAPERRFRTSRHEEDWSFLRDPTKAREPMDGAKFIPLNSEGDAYLSLNGEMRMRFDYTERRNFLAAPSATIGPGNSVRFARPTGDQASELLKQRYAFGADLHLNRYLRFYAQAMHAEQSGHGAGAVIPASQRNELALVNGFVEAKLPLEDATLGVRLGREALFFGNNRQIAANVATSLPDPTFDGVRLYIDLRHTRLDLFSYNVYRYAADFFEGIETRRRLWGAYATTTLPEFELWGTTAKPSLDAFYFGFRSAQNPVGPGSGTYQSVPLIEERTISSTRGFKNGTDLRHTFGLRLHGQAGNFDWDHDVALQSGRFADRDVQAWAFNTNSGYSFAALPWRPRLGAKINGASGGAGNGVLRTYQPMFPDTLYYLPNSFFTPTNFFNISPSLTVRPFQSVTAEFYYAFLWRASEADAVYTGNWKGANGTNAFAASALARGAEIGQMPNLTVTWTPSPYLVLRTTLAQFLPGDALKNVGATPTTYVNAQATLRF